MFNVILQALFVGTILGASAFPEHSGSITIAIILGSYLAVSEILSTLKTEKVSKESLQRLEKWDEQSEQHEKVIEEVLTRLKTTEDSIEQIHVTQRMKNII